MKQWKLIVVTLLAVLMVCVCTSAMADHICQEQPYTVTKAPTCTEPGTATYNKCTVPGCKDNKEYTFVLEATEHDFSKKSNIKQPTCTEQGYDIYTCTKCGEKTKKNFVDALGHTEVVKGVRKVATCTEEGIKVYECSVCKEELRTEAIPMVEHTYNDAANSYVKPTCTEQGYYIWRCTECGNVKKDLFEDPKHTVREFGPKEATCTEEGHSAYLACWYCDWTEGYELYEKKAHTEAVKGTRKEATCTEEGIKVIWCSVCEKELRTEPIAKKEHAWTLDGEHHVDATCTEDGSDFYYCYDCDASKTEVIKANGAHAMLFNTHVDPDCENYGYHLWKCANCDYTEEREIVEALGHEWEKINTFAPTCVKEGYEWWYCPVCEKGEKRAEVPANGHTWEDLFTVEPTCQAGGFTRQICAIDGCEARQNVNKTEKVDHVWAEKGVTVDSTCTETGYTRYPCTFGCGENNVVTIEKKPHDFKKLWHREYVSCEGDGYEIYQCTKCDAKTEKMNVVPATGHNYVLTANVAATCTTEGKQGYRCYNEGCETPEKWETLEKLSHSYADTKWVDVAAATCTLPGRQKNDCIMCDDNPIYRDTPATGHDFEDAVYYKNPNAQPTCTKDGEGWQACKNCSYEINVVIPALNHKNAVSTTLVAATCTSQGMKQTVCPDCNKTTYELIAATGHGKIEVVSENKPTCTEAGVITKKCGVCDETFVETVAALGHDMVAGAVTAPTCTEKGYTTYECSRCDVTEIKDETEATGHVKTEEVAVVAPTCTEAGSVNVVCECGEVVETKAVAALGHDMVAGAVTAPTCTEKGYTTYECSRCDANEQKDETAALGHNYEWVMDAVVASPAAPGENWYQCTVCEDVADIEYVKYTKYYYENTLTSFGPTTEELLGEGDWYRVTPIDLSVDGIYTFDLIASNAYVVGTVTITVSEGVMTVSYDVNANHIEVLEEALVLYASKADLAEGKGVTVAFGEEINLAETFGEDSKVLVSLMLTGTYDAAGYGVYGFEADAEEIAELLAIVD